MGGVFGSEKEYSSPIKWCGKSIENFQVMLATVATLQIRVVSTQSELVLIPIFESHRILHTYFRFLHFT